VCRFFHQESRRHTRLIYNGIDTKRFGVVPAEQRQSVRASLGLPSDRRIILFVGRFVRKKGLHIVESLTRRFPEVLWIFVGSGPEDPSKWSYTNVQVPGRIEHERLAAFYHAADLLLLPSYGEGFPLVVQEALACGLGVLSTTEVGTACPAAREMIRTQPTPRGRVDITGWETALRATLLDEAYLAARDSRSRKARELWSWERCTSEYLSLFDEVMTPGR
jgi:glycosyltransferase involved in cell wall biosynthesis